MGINDVYFLKEATISLFLFDFEYTNCQLLITINFLIQH